MYSRIFIQLKNVVPYMYSIWPSCSNILNVAKVLIEIRKTIAIHSRNRSILNRTNWKNFYRKNYFFENNSRKFDLHELIKKFKTLPKVQQIQKKYKKLAAPQIEPYLKQRKLIKFLHCIILKYSKNMLKNIKTIYAPD